MPNYRVRYQYETSPRKLEPEYEPPKENPYSKKKSSTLKKKDSQVKKKTKTKRHLKKHVKAVLYIAFIFSALFVISYRNSVINEIFTTNEALKEDLAAIQKENEQLQVSIENSLNLSNIEKLAEERLGMQKLDSSQKVYVSLDKEDYVESAAQEVEIDEDDSNWLDSVIEFLGL